MHGADSFLRTIREGRVGSKTTVMGLIEIDLQEESQLGYGGVFFIDRAAFNGCLTYGKPGNSNFRPDIDAGRDWSGSMTSYMTPAILTWQGINPNHETMLNQRGRTRVRRELLGMFTLSGLES